MNTINKKENSRKPLHLVRLVYLARSRFGCHQLHYPISQISQDLHTKKNNRNKLINNFGLFDVNLQDNHFWKSIKLELQILKMYVSYKRYFRYLTVVSKSLNLLLSWLHNSRQEKIPLAIILNFIILPKMFTNIVFISSLDVKIFIASATCSTFLFFKIII